jgi:hypothetical protein
MAFPEDIIAKIRQDFSEDDELPILQLLTDFQKRNPTLNDRILRCIVFLANGNFEKFATAIRMAEIDWRDLICAAEYDELGRARVLSLPFKGHPDVELIKTWLCGKTFPIPWRLDENSEWTVDRSEIRELSIEQVYPANQTDQSPSEVDLPFALISFLLIRGPREISASMAMEGKACVHYFADSVTSQFHLKKIVSRPEWLKKRGHW